MYVILAAGFISLIPPVYFLRLMADARRLERRLPVRPAANIEEGQKTENEELLITHHYANWMAIDIKPFSSEAEPGQAPIPDRGGPAAAPD